MLRRLSYALFLLLSSLCAEARCWDPYVEAEGWFGDWHQGGGASLFVPLQQHSRDLLFAEGRGQRLRDQWVASGGVGYRRLATPNLAFGVNGFLDYCRLDSSRSYLQFGAGAELLGSCFEARVNGYVPHQNGRRLVETLCIERHRMVGVDLVDRRTDFVSEERAYTGFDAEGGLVVCAGPGYVRALGGYFHYQSHRAPTIEGPRVRLVYEWDDPFEWCGARLSIGWQYTYDRVRHSEAGGFVSLRIPLGCPKRGRRCWKSSVCRRMGDRVLRERGIIATRRKREEVVMTPVVGRHGQPCRLFFVGGGDGAGTQDDPTTLEEAQALSAPGDVIFCLGDGGEIAMAKGLSMKPGQQLIGFGGETSRIVSFGPDIELLIEDQSGCGRAALRRDKEGHVLSLADGALVSGLKIDGGDDAIVGQGCREARIEDVLIENSSACGVCLRDADDAAIEQVRCQKIGVSGIFLQGSRASIRDVFIAKTGGPALHLVDVAAPSLARVLVEGAGAQGILVEGQSSSLALSDISVSGASEGMRLEGVETLSLQGAKLCHASQSGLTLADCSGSVAIEGAQIEGNGTWGVRLIGGSADCSFEGNAIHQEGGGLVLADGTQGTICFTGGTLKSERGTGLVVRNTRGGKLFFDAPEIRDATDTAISLANNNASIAMRGAALSTTRSGTGLRIQGGSPAAAVTFSSSQLTQSDGGTAIDIDGTASCLDLKGLTVRHVGARRAPPLRVRNTQGGAVHFGSVTATDVGASDAALFDSNAACTTFDNLTVHSLGESGVRAVMGDGDLSFRQLHVASQGAGVDVTATERSRGQFAVTGDGSRLSGGVVEADKGRALSFTNVSSVALSDMCVRALGGEAINYTTLRDDHTSLNINALDVQSADSGMHLSAQGNGATKALVRGCSIKAGRGCALEAQLGSRGSLVVAIDDNQLASLAGSGVLLCNPDGSLDALKITSLSGIHVTEAADGGIVIQGATFAGEEPVVCSDTRIGAASSRIRGDGMRLDRVAGTLQLNGLRVATDGGTALHVAGEPGAFALFADDGVLDAARGQAMLIKEAQVDASLASVSSSGSPKEGVCLDAIRGRVNIESGLIDNAASSGFAIYDSDASITYSGEIVNHSDRMIEICGASGGSALFNGARYVDDGGMGVAVYASAMDVALSNAKITNNDEAAGVDLCGHTGRFALSDSHISGRGPVGLRGWSVGDMLVDRCEVLGIKGSGPLAGISLEEVSGAVTLSNCVIGAFGERGQENPEGIRIVGMEGTLHLCDSTIKAIVGRGSSAISMSSDRDLSVQVARCHVTAAPFHQMDMRNGIQMEIKGSASVDVTIEDSEFHALSQCAVFAAIKRASEASLDLTVARSAFGSENPILGLDNDAIVLRNCPGAIDSAFTYHIIDNAFSNIDGHALHAACMGKAAGSQMVGLVQGNTAHLVGFSNQPGHNAYQFTVEEGSEAQHEVRVESNTTRHTARAAVVGKNRSAEGSLRLTLNDHSDSGSNIRGKKSAAFQIKNIGKGRVDAELTGNETTGRLGIHLENPGGGVFTVADPMTLRSTNKDMRVRQDQTVQGFHEVEQRSLDPDCHPNLLIE